jgi:hypothetical protein
MHRDFSRARVALRLVASLLLTASAASHAALVVPTSQLSFQAAVSVPGLDTFESLAPGVATPAPIARTAGSYNDTVAVGPDTTFKGKVAEQALPVFRNVIEAVTYALFPLLVLLLLLTSGRETMLAFKGCRPVQTNACDNTTDRCTGGRADAPEDRLQTPSFARGGNHTRGCTQQNEGDEDGCPHVKNSSNRASVDPRIPSNQPSGRLGRR